MSIRATFGLPTRFEPGANDQTTADRRCDAGVVRWCSTADEQAEDMVDERSGCPNGAEHEVGDLSGASREPGVARHEADRERGQADCTNEERRSFRG